MSLFINDEKGLIEPYTELPVMALAVVGFIVFIAVLAGCVTLPQDKSGGATATSILNSTSPIGTAGDSVLSSPTTWPTLIPFLTLRPITPGPPPTLTPVPTNLPTLTPLPANLPKFPLDGYIAVFNKNGDLYFQNGNHLPTKLTHVGESAPAPILSNDNQKIVFFREASGYSTLYSINTDGSHEQTLVTKRSLPQPLFDHNAQTFVPGTHQFLFNTYKCESQEERPLCAVGVSLVNTDTGETKELIPPGEPGLYNSDGNFKVSPDGKWVSIAAYGHIDILDMDGKIDRKGVLPYVASLPSFNFSSRFPVQFWLPDSSGLIAGLPNITNHTQEYDDVPAYTIWQYTIADNTAIQIGLDPSPMMVYGANEFQVSPDGNWILYGGNGLASSLYLANLISRHTQLFGDMQFPGFSWSPDSKHFVYGRYLGALDQPSVLISRGGYILAWIDAGHFLYRTIEPSLKIRVGEIEGGTIKFYDLGFEAHWVYIIKPK